MIAESVVFYIENKSGTQRNIFSQIHVKMNEFNVSIVTIVLGNAKF